MVNKVTTSTAADTLKSTGPEVEAKSRPSVDNSASLAEKQAEASATYDARKLAEADMTPAEIASAKRELADTPPADPEPPRADTVRIMETSKRPTISLKSAIRRFPKVRQAFVSALVRLFGSEFGAVYDLTTFRGTTGGLALILADHVKRRVPTKHPVQRINNLLTAHTLQLEPAPQEIVQKRSVNPRTNEELIPQLKRPTGPNNYAKVIAIVFELRALQAVCDKAGMLWCKAEAVKAQIALDFALENWSPFEREKHPDPKVQEKMQVRHDLSTVQFSDEQGDWIQRMRLNLAVACETVYQRERLKEHLKKLRNSHSWLVGLLKNVDRKIEVEIEAQEKTDRAAQRTAALSAIRAGYETDFHGLRWDRFLSEQERRDLAAAKEELERDLSVETEIK